MTRLGGHPALCAGAAEVRRRDPFRERPLPARVITQWSWTDLVTLPTSDRLRG